MVWGGWCGWGGWWGSAAAVRPFLNVRRAFVSMDKDGDGSLSLLEVLPALRKVFAKGALAAEALAREEAKLGTKSVRRKRRAQFVEVSHDLNRIFYEFPFAVPDYFALITRALIVLEGIALTGDKDFDIFRPSS